ncbi:MAG: hypothetical protein LBG48_05410, partial [Rickettsiales bacterium]|nr:hypothetical protein [Rickettsiales bacterium]
TWNTVYQTTNAVCLIGRARTLTSNVPKIQVSLDNSTWFTLWSGEGYLVNGSPSFNLTIPKGYYYRGTGGTDGTLKEYKLMGYNN